MHLVNRINLREWNILKYTNFALYQRHADLSISIKVVVTVFMLKYFTFVFWKRKFISLRKLIAWKLFPYTESIRKKRIKRQINYYKAKGFLPVEVGSDAGIGAKLLWYLQILLYCKENNLKPYIKFTYDDNREEDYFDQFITSKYTIPTDIKYIRIVTLWDLNFGQHYDKDKLSVEMANSLAQEFITIKKEFIDEANSFASTHFGNDKVLGVHYRSTDKVTEAGFVSHQTALANIDHCFKHYNHFNKIFITTDDNKFIEFLKRSHLSSYICYRQDTYRSDDEKAVHTRLDVDRFNMNKDAIVNMLILTKCSFIIKTASNLSAISLFLNPSIPYMLLNIMYKLYFPDNEFSVKASLKPVEEV